MLQRLIKLADYLDSSGELFHANRVDKMIYRIAQIQEIHAPETDEAIESRIKELSEAWISKDEDTLSRSGINLDHGISQLRYIFDRLLGSHSNPWSLLGDGWKIDLDQYDYLTLFRPDGSIGSDDSDDPIDYIAIYLILKIEEDQGRGQQHTPDIYEVPEPVSLMEREKALDPPDPMSAMQETTGWSFEFPEGSRGMHA